MLLEGAGIRRGGSRRTAQRVLAKTGVSVSHTTVQNYRWRSGQTFCRVLLFRLTECTVHTAEINDTFNFEVPKLESPCMQSAESLADEPKSTRTRAPTGSREEYTHKTH